MQTIRFDLQVDHPYGYLLKFAKHMKGNRDLPVLHFKKTFPVLVCVGEKQRIERVLQMAWTFINDR